MKTDIFTAPPWLQPRTAYFHIPFCAHHCGYCDFAVSVGNDHLIELYLDALELEIQRTSSHPIETAFIGGGTPTHLSPRQLERFLKSIRANFFFVDDASREFSIESTPESFSEEKVAVLADYGVNRVSIGVQSFQDQTLGALDRKHSVQQIAQALEWVRRKIPVVSLDLIFAAPGQSNSDWERDLKSALAYQPEHLSTYGLTYEKGTPLWKQRERGLVHAVEEDQELHLYAHAIETLTSAGYEHYEISNYAKPGHRCRHNERYWANEAYFGLGVGAARYQNGVRELNVRDTKKYIQLLLSGEPATFQSERLDPRSRAFETIAVQLRRSDGIDRSRFLTQSGMDLDELIGEPITHLIAQELLSDDGRSVRLTLKGKFLADGMIEHLMKSQC